jgi:mannitol-1-phosphate 5-dehydrogenase
MIAVHFGAGNIGRGFIGYLLSQAGYQVTFIDVNEELVHALNQQKHYQVVTCEDRPVKTEIRNVTAINSQKEEQKVLEIIAEADLVTTAVGPPILSRIAPVLAKGLNKRLQETKNRLNVIACENMLNSSQTLKKHVLSQCTSTEQKQIEEAIGFPNAVVDCIVPNQQTEIPLQVQVEPYFEWVVDELELKGVKPPIEQIDFVDHFEAYINRKLYTVNTGHAVIAYVGYLEGYQTIVEAIKSARIEKIVKNCLQETSQLLVMEYDFDPHKHHKYVERILRRFHNTHINDDITRVARSPLRKLGPHDRLFDPAIRLSEKGIRPIFLTIGIAAALLYDWPEDPEAIELQERLKREGLVNTLSKLSGLQRQHILLEWIKEEYDELERAKNKELILRK